jgi:hypothetical protein
MTIKFASRIASASAPRHLTPGLMLSVSWNTKSFVERSRRTTGVTSAAS